MDNWTLYEHISPSGKIYVGVTSRKVAQRWGSNGNRYLFKANGKFIHPHFAQAIIKYGWNNFIHKIVASNLGEKTAKNMEKDLIAFNKAKGISYNITDGGDGRLGTTFNHSEESKHLISINHRRVQTEATKVKISKAQLGKKFSQGRKNLLQEAHNFERVKVEQYSKNSIFIASYNSIMDAERATGVKSGNISAACRGKIRTAGGYIWKRV